MVSICHNLLVMGCRQAVTAHCNQWRPQLSEPSPSPEPCHLHPRARPFQISLLPLHSVLYTVYAPLQASIQMRAVEAAKHLQEPVDVQLSTATARVEAR